MGECQRGPHGPEGEGGLRLHRDRPPPRRPRAHGVGGGWRRLGARLSAVAEEAAGELRVDLSVAELEGVAAAVSPDMVGNSADGRTYYHFAGHKLRTITARLKNPGTIMLVGEDAKTGGYFATRFRPELPEAEAKGGLPHGIFVVDISLSSNPERFNIWLTLMEAVLNNNRDSLMHFAVLFFNVETFWWTDGFRRNTPANVEKLMKYANTLALEGATDMSAVLSKAALPPWLKMDEMFSWDVFLMSDAASTWGEGDLNALSKALRNMPPLFAYTTGLAGTDTKALQFLARETGGAVFSVVGEAEIEKASRAHRSKPWDIADVHRIAAAT